MLAPLLDFCSDSFVGKRLELAEDVQAMVNLRKLCYRRLPREDVEDIKIAYVQTLSLGGTCNQFWHISGQ